MPGTYVALYLRVRWRWGGGVGRLIQKLLTSKTKKKTKNKTKQKS